MLAMARRFGIVAARRQFSTAPLSVGSAFPMDAIVHNGFAGNTPDSPQPMSSFLEGKRAIVVTLPGAFTPT